MLTQVNNSRLRLATQDTVSDHHHLYPRALSPLSQPSPVTMRVASHISRARDTSTTKSTTADPRSRKGSLNLIAFRTNRRLTTGTALQVVWNLLLTRRHQF